MFQRPALGIRARRAAQRPWFWVAPLVLAGLWHTWDARMVANDARNGGSKPFVTLLNPAQVSARLRENEESFVVDRGNGVLRYDLSQVPSNNPVEDDHSERVVSVPLVTPSDSNYSTDWHFWGIYDGHGGWSTSRKLRESLIPYVTRELDKIYTPVAPGAQSRFEPSDPRQIDKALTDAFCRLDDDIVNKSVAYLFANPSKKSALEAIPTAISGSCALLAQYDTQSHELRLAVTGDSRAVLGVQQPGGQWHAQALTTDQTGSNEDEVNRIRAEHPGEKDTAVRRGRVLGIYEPTRSFGDAITKWSPEIQRKLAHDFFARNMPRYLRTPPYMTAEPVVTRTKIDPKRPTFLVLGSDGLYEMLSNDQVISLVVDWMETKRPRSLESILNTAPKPPRGWLSYLSRKAPAERAGTVVEDVSGNKDNQKPPVRAGRHAGPHAPPLQAQIVDDNVATHIIRNALGHGDPEQTAMLLSIPAPMSRRYRDDLTVTVIFFGESGEAQTTTGKILVNQEATKPVKAKL